MKATGAGRRETINDETFTRLCELAREHGRDAAYRWFAEGATDSEGRPARRRTLDDYLRRHPDRAALFEDECNARRDALLGAVRHELEEIALGPGDETIDFNKSGGVARRRVDRRNKMYAILRLLESIDPDTWSQRRKVDTSVSGRIDHAHQHTLAAPGVYSITADDVMHLPGDKADELFALLDLLESNRNDQRQIVEQPERPSEPPRLEAQDGPRDGE